MSRYYYDATGKLVDRDEIARQQARQDPRAPHRPYTDEDGHYIVNGVAYQDWITYKRVQQQRGHSGGFWWTLLSSWFWKGKDFREFAVWHCWLTVWACGITGMVMMMFGNHFAPQWSTGSFIALWAGLCVCWWIVTCTYTLPVGYAYFKHGQNAAVATAAVSIASGYAMAHHAHHKLAQQHMAADMQSAAQKQQSQADLIVAQQQAILNQALGNAQQPGWVPTFPE